MTLPSTVLAIGWEPELRGILIVIIAVVTLCGSVYLVLATNLGARLGFLVALAGLAGWMVLMGIIWMIYGIGLQGPGAVVGGRARAAPCCRTPARCSRPACSTQPVDVPEDADVRRGRPTLVADAVRSPRAGTPLDEEEPSFGQAGVGRGDVPRGDRRVRRRRVPGRQRVRHRRRAVPEDRRRLDFLAFCHKPHYVVVEVAPLEPTRTEPGRAPAAAEIDETRQHQYVYMVRDLGTRRQPAVRADDRRRR